jgi:arginyl-tRNA synthetase
VALAMCAMNPAMRGRQYHVSYDLVKLTTGKMSGRRGRYLLADDLYTELKDIIKHKLETRFKEKGDDVSPELFAKVRCCTAMKKWRIVILARVWHFVIENGY